MPETLHRIHPSERLPSDRFVAATSAAVWVVARRRDVCPHSKTPWQPSQLCGCVDCERARADYLDALER